MIFCYNIGNELPYSIIQRGVIKQFFFFANENYYILKVNFYKI